MDARLADADLTGRVELLAQFPIAAIANQQIGRVGVGERRLARRRAGIAGGVLGEGWGGEKEDSKKKRKEEKK
jgi:hypothetical protein